MRLTPGTRIGPYEIEGAIGAGGMGEVYRARDNRLDRTVAIKLLRDDGDIATGKLLKEARAIARLNHPNIASLYDVVREGNLAVLIMEYVDGEPLSTRVSSGPTDLERAVQIGIQLTDALAYAHREGVIHRDIKPGNVLLTRDHAVKLLDLGIARSVAGSTADTRTETEDGISREGTPAYMAPEQVAGRAATAQSDIYSTGVLLYELLTGRPAFAEDNPLSLAIHIVNGPTPRVADVRPEIPKTLDQIVARAMSIEPAKRQPDAGTLNAELRGFLDEWKTGTKRDVALVASKRRTLIGLVAAAAILAGVGWIWMNQKPVPTGAVRIAVLPAANPSEDPAIEIFGENLVAVLMDNLASAPGIALVSSDPGNYRVASRDAQQAARAIGNGYLVDLRLQKQDALVKVEERLLSAAGSQPLWREEFTGRPFEAGQRAVSDLTGAIERARLLGRSLSTEQRAALSRWPTSDAAAFDAYLKGRSLVLPGASRKNLEQGRDAFDDAIQKDPRFAVAHAGRAQALIGLAQDPSMSNAATVSAKRAMELMPASAYVQEVMARVDRAAGRQEDAERHAREAVRLAPDNDRSHQLLGLILWSRKQVDAGLEEVRIAIRLRPASPSNLYSLGFLLYRSGRYADAIEPMTRAVELQPNSTSNLNLLGAAHHQLGDADTAIGYYARALALGADAQAYSNLATAYYDAGKYTDAVSNYRAAIALDATSATTHRNLGDAYLRLQRPAEARAEYSEAIRRADAALSLNAQDASTMALKAVCEGKIGQHTLAQQFIAAARTFKGGDDAEVVFRAAVVDALANRPADAMRNLEEALKLGYSKVFARQDWDLAPLRSLPAYAALFPPKAPLFP